ncbi:hypothetical protein DL96DRAFT_1622896 [Flagelloscypha sp. PMI_526]|nr:hypothetical protein DL96DRAFT_1622896 [Flagelloscypha sp. PMI_526]
MPAPSFPQSSHFASISTATEAAVGGEGEWLPLPSTTRLYTNAYIFHEEKILLGMKKRGFGLGKWNGFGGKVHEGETSLQAASRELQEEAGISAPLKHAGILLFINQGSDLAHHIDLYRADSFNGDVTETDEMQPSWFSALPSEVEPPVDLPRIPFDKMWDDDRHWFPLLLSNTFFIGRADFHEPTPNHFVPGRFWFGLPPP